MASEQVLQRRTAWCQENAATLLSQKQLEEGISSLLSTAVNIYWLQQCEPGADSGREIETSPRASELRGLFFTWCSSWVLRAKEWSVRKVSCFWKSHHSMYGIIFLHALWTTKISSVWFDAEHKSYHWRITNEATNIHIKACLAKENLLGRRSFSSWTNSLR